MNMKIETLPDIQIGLAANSGLAMAVGNTPLLPLHRVAEGVNPDVQVFAKAEWFNPGGSVKDRPALNILNAALERGDLSPGKRLLDSTSGNMGIAYATLGASMGIPVTLAIPSNASAERIKILKSLGAELVLTDPTEGSDGAILVAMQMAEKRPELYYYANQYNNPANWQAHYNTTGPEIVQQAYLQSGRQVTHFVAGLGTSGTFMGTSRFMKEHLPEVKCISFEPNSPLHGIEGLKHMPSAIQPGIYDPSLADNRLSIKTERAYEMTRRLAREEGLFVGISSGAAAIAALEVARQLESGIVVTIFPDSGYRYLSDHFWEEES